MNLHLTIGPIVSLVAGILILVMPRLLNYIVAIQGRVWPAPPASARIADEQLITIL